jgi:hypothetical protein
MLIAIQSCQGCITDPASVVDRQRFDVDPDQDPTQDRQKVIPVAKVNKKRQTYNLYNGTVASLLFLEHFYALS